MPEKKTLDRARRAKREGKRPTAQAGEFVREEMHHVREGKHGARSRQQAVAVGLSKARKAGVKVPSRGKGKRKTARTTPSTKRKAATSRRRSAASKKALKRERKAV